MSELRIDLASAACRRDFTVSFSQISGNEVVCPSCGAANSVTEDQIDAAVEKNKKSERKGMKPKFGSV